MKIIYVYTTPNMSSKGFLKIGETTLRKDKKGNFLSEKESVITRIKEQFYTAGSFNEKNQLN